MKKDGDKGSFLRSSWLLALCTLFSRLLGFFREMLTADVIGGGALMSGWATASKVANIFRRVLGEGELGKVLVPVVSGSVKKDGPEVAQNKFSTILIYQTFVLVSLSLLIGIPSFFIADHCVTERWYLTWRLISIMMPYSVFICLVGAMSAYANSMREYVLPSLAAILQNLILVFTLYFLCPLYEGAAKLDVLAISVLIAGVFELLLLLWVMHRLNIHIRINRAILGDMATLKDVLRLLIPGLIAASSLQLSQLCDQWIAMWIGDYAVPALTYSDRLIYLPIGIFAVSFATVSNTEMSRLAADQDYRKMGEILMRAMRILLFLTIPLAAFLFLFSEPTLRMFYFRGNFTLESLAATKWAFCFYVFGIPSFAVYKVTVMGFTTRKDMITPFRIALVCVVLNLILNLILMWPLKQGGIALATVVTSYLNNVFLLYFLSRHCPSIQMPYRSLTLFLLKWLPASLIALIPAWMLFSRIYPPCLEMAKLSGKVTGFFWQVLALGTVGIVFGMALLILGIILRVDEFRFVLSKIPGVRKFIRKGVEK